MKRYYAVFSPEWGEYVRMHGEIGFATNSELRPPYLYEDRRDAERVKTQLLEEAPWKFSTLNIVHID